MAGELTGANLDGTTCVFVAFNAANQVWNTSGTPAFENWNDAHYTAGEYSITATPEGTSGWFTGNTPSALATYYQMRQVIGGTPSTDPIVWQDVVGGSASPTNITAVGSVTNPVTLAASQNFNNIGQTTAQAATSASIQAGLTAYGASTYAGGPVASVTAAVTATAASVQAGLSAQGLTTGVVTNIGTTNTSVAGIVAGTVIVTANTTQLAGVTVAGPGSGSVTFANTVGTSTLTQAQVTGGAYALQTNNSGYVSMNPTGAAIVATGIFTDVNGADFLINGSPGKILAIQLGGAFTTFSSSILTTSALQNAPSGGGGSVPGYHDVAQGPGPGANTIQLAVTAGSLTNLVGQQIFINYENEGTQEGNTVTAYSPSTQVATCQNNWKNTITNETEYVFPLLLGSGLNLGSNQNFNNTGQTTPYPQPPQLQVNSIQTQVNQSPSGQ